jgi:hypothetical protein
MKTRIAFLLLITIPGWIAFGQQVTAPLPPDTKVESVGVSGVSDSKLSSTLRDDMQKLVGQVYDPEAAARLAEGIQIELAEYVAAATTVPGSQSGRIRLVFVVAKISDNDALKSNINSRYIVEAVEVTGKPTPKTSDALNADLQAMVGKPLDNALADKLGKRIVAENNSIPNLGFQRKLRRGTTPQHVKIVYDVHLGSSFGFGVSDVAYHSKQGFSGSNQTKGFGIFEYKPRNYGVLSVHAFNDGNTLIERYAGIDYRYSVEASRFQIDSDYSSFRAQWKRETLEASQSAGAPGMYRLRDTFGTSVEIKLPSQFNAKVGAFSSELQMQTPALHFEKNRVLTGSLGGRYVQNPGANQQVETWNYSIHSSADTLGSDFIYTRHEWDLDYNAGFGPLHAFHAQFIGGKITGNAPLYERFSLGNGTNLVGWNKYEIAPLGGNRVAYATAWYKFPIVTPFYNVGAVWDAGQPANGRQSIGVRFRGPGIICPKGPSAVLNPLCWGITVAVPMRSGQVKPVITFGF